MMYKIWREYKVETKSRDARRGHVLFVGVEFEIVFSLYASRYPFRRCRVPLVSDRPPKMEGEGGGGGGEGEEILMVVEVDGRLDEEEVVHGSRIWKRKLEVVIRDRDIAL